MSHLTRPLLLCLLSVAAAAAPAAVEYVYPGFTASNYYYIDNLGGVFLTSAGSAFSAMVTNSYNGKQLTGYYLAVVHVSGALVWAANRDAPTSSAGLVNLTVDGLTVAGHDGSVLWSTPKLTSPVASMRLTDGGGLQLLDRQNGTLWESWDAPTDTMLSTQPLAVGAVLTSARSDADIASGDYRMVIGEKDVSLTWLGATYWRLGNDGRSFQLNGGKAATMSVNATGMYLLAGNGAVILWVVLPAAAAGLRIVKLGADGLLTVTSYASVNSTAPSGAADFTAPTGGCQLPVQCGELGLCTVVSNTSTCNCPPRFTSPGTPPACVPVDGAALASCGNAAAGGNRIAYAELGSGVFSKALKYRSAVVTGVTDADCRDRCSGNCSCRAYFFDNSTTRCFFLDLPKLGSVYAGGDSDTFGYVKLVKSNAGETETSSSVHLVAILLPTVAAVLLIVTVACFVYPRLRRRDPTLDNPKMRSSLELQLGRTVSPRLNGAGDSDDGDQLDEMLIPGLPKRFTYAEIESMTGGFSTLIGSGGFGSVYRGELPDSTPVAVKKIEAPGVHANREFVTEIAVIGNIHHVNLVRLRGFCAERSKRILVYEYMNRSSLDQTLFASSGVPVLEWGERMEIAIGAAKGLAYLHTGCDRKIVHCDVKPENILLADGGQVKIADFGLAKLMAREQSALFTTMRGTRGYLAPEWLTNAPISDRADVYSYGMVLLEIIHGRKNRVQAVAASGGDDAVSGVSSLSAVSSGTGSSEYFPLAALEMHEDGGPYAVLADPRLQGRVGEREVARAVRVALCCLHEDPALRPSMSAVVRMLEGSVPATEPRLDALGFLQVYGRANSGAAATPPAFSWMESSGLGSADGAGGGGRRSETRSAPVTAGAWSPSAASSQLSGPR